MGPCMCGDTYCSSCGPAQGNHRCYACGKWSMDGGCDNPAACDEILKAQEQKWERELEEGEDYDCLDTILAEQELDHEN